MDIVEYLSNADERLEWNVNGMPKDGLSMENAILLKRFNRYPLIIDPSGQALEFIQKQYGGKQSNFQVTSFLDQSFRLAFCRVIKVSYLERRSSRLFASVLHFWLRTSKTMIQF
jgi:hypothetical protein